MTNPARAQTLFGRLVRTGLRDAARAQSLCEDPDLVAVVGPVEPEHGLLAALGVCADPDLALLTFVRLCAALRAPAADGALEHGPRIMAIRDLFVPTDPLAPQTDQDQIRRMAMARLFAVMGHSRTLCDDLVRRPYLVDLALDVPTDFDLSAQYIRAHLLTACKADPHVPMPVAGSDPEHATGQLRRAYHEILLQIAAYDLTDPMPTDLVGPVSRALADLAAAALEGALAIARARLADHGAGVRIAVMGMGKCGGRELNYVSDVDVIYVVEPADGYDQDYALDRGTTLAKNLALACSAPGQEQPLWPVDAALRPEGKQGPLVRTVESHRAYYERWAQTWEFQALLKARLVAGDPELADRYLAAVRPMVWTAASRTDFVEDSQAMRRRVEDNVPAAEADRQLKLGKGGLRDVEFTVQLLQLVHGRHDPSIHSSNTLEALDQLAAGGYVGREHAAELARCYEFLRLLEHRLQLRNLRRTHLMPTDPFELEVLARSVGLRKLGGAGLHARWLTVRRNVRGLHEALFYRPLLPATARLSAEEASLAPEAAQARLAAVGFKDPVGAMHHITALTEGLTRRAAIQRQLLPVMIGWFSQGADPDLGLLGFRVLSDDLGATHWYLKLLRDSGTVAQRLALILSTSKYASAALTRSPESIAWLDKGEDLQVRSAERLILERDALLARAESPEAAITALRALRRRELARIACAELITRANSRVVAQGITDVTDVCLAGALTVAQQVTAAEPAVTGEVAGYPADIALIAMGRMGGREMGYGSDADIMVVYAPASAATDAAAQDFAHRTTTTLRTLLSDPGTEPALALDFDLRPEGRNGPLVRSLDSYAKYYANWSAPWESQALLRARVVTGDAVVAREYVNLIAGLRYPQDGLSAGHIREIRRIKARMEAERLPRGVDSSRHLKLGRGSISDVEWVVQLLQLCHGYRVPELQTTETLAGLAAAQGANLLTAREAKVLGEAWQFASNLRDAVVLWTGRTSGPQLDVLPADRVALNAVGRVLGYPQKTASQVQEDYLRKARRARKVMERVFYGDDS